MARSDHELLVSPPSATTDLPTTLPAAFQPDDDEDDEDDDFELPALDPVLMAKIQARHLTAKALSGSDVRFSGESSVDKKCQVMVQPRLDPKKAPSMDENAKQRWMTKKAFDAPRVSHSRVSSKLIPQLKREVNRANLSPQSTKPWGRSWTSPVPQATSSWSSRTGPGYGHATLRLIRSISRTLKPRCVRKAAGQENAASYHVLIDTHPFPLVPFAF